MAKKRYIFKYLEGQCPKILEHFGNYSQLIKAIEEMSELQKEICKIIVSKEAKLAGVIEETADCFIMLMQLRRFFGQSKVDKAIEEKIGRVFMRMSDETDPFGKDVR
jgi:hypothetical protein